MFADNPGWFVKKEYRKRGTAAPEEEDEQVFEEVKAEEKHHEMVRALE